MVILPENVYTDAKNNNNHCEVSFPQNLKKVIFFSSKLSTEYLKIQNWRLKLMVRSYHHTPLNPSLQILFYVIFIKKSCTSVIISKFKRTYESLISLKNDIEMIFMQNKI